MKVDISIIMPAYNAERYIGQAIDSILQQKFSGSYELLIADDMSSDGTPEVIKKYQKLFPTIVKPTFRFENLGCSGNSLSLALTANGQYLAFCDTDDIWVDVHKLQKQYDFLEKNPDYGMVCTHANIIDENGDIIDTTKSIYANDSEEECIDLDKVSVMKSHCDVFNSSVMIRRDLYLKMKGECAWYVENNCFIDSVWAYYCTSHSKVKLFLQPMILYRLLSNSDSHTDNYDKLYFLSKRATLIRQSFLSSDIYTLNERLDIISSEFDYVFQIGLREGNNRAKQTITYKFGKLILSPIIILRKLFHLRNGRIH